ncbi:MAG: UDP-N-acetylmuramoyl-L-alanine--D-glutamate ligase [Verrucomicrobia bacterium]|nr:UDP-N-acetylmuramoyl-L-alanine--D-glutamate ligase [Verrucomicrobiota bacterium]MCF7708870.1 UDP-N-acetylmuramoyl-L-alanine--D-glutamate ligase [Verrucomicrobiota bacterium]
MTNGFEKENVLVIGLGASGAAACRLLMSIGATVAAVDGADTQGLRRDAAELRAAGAGVWLGARTLPQVEFAVAVLSPGIPMDNPFVIEARRRGVPIISEVELGFRFCGSSVIAVTGTNGKTTVTELIEAALKAGGLDLTAAGNIGLPFSAVCNAAPSPDYALLEISSFQLETIDEFRADVGVLTNITPDHLDRHKSIDEYAEIKSRLFINQRRTDSAVIQSDALELLRRLGVAPRAKVITYSATDGEAGLFMGDGCIRARLDGWPEVILAVDDLKITGLHNVENAMAALGVAYVVGAPLDEVKRALLEYSPAPHRCEFVAEYCGVRFVNDSKATNIDAVGQAVLAVSAEATRRPGVVLLAGGRDKGLDYEGLGNVLGEHVKQVFLIGEAAPKLYGAWRRFVSCSMAVSMVDAVYGAAEIARAGDVVLLSPACSSFDMFDNYQHRGFEFRRAVQSWLLEKGDSAGFGGPADRGEERFVFNE